MFKNSNLSPYEKHFRDGLPSGTSRYFLDDSGRVRPYVGELSTDELKTKPAAKFHSWRGNALAIILALVAGKKMEAFLKRQDIGKKNRLFEALQVRESRKRQQKQSALWAKRRAVLIGTALAFLLALLVAWNDERAGNSRAAQEA